MVEKKRPFVAIEDLEKVVDNKYKAIVIAAKEAHRIFRDFKMLGGEIMGGELRNFSLESLKRLIEKKVVWKEKEKER